MSPNTALIPPKCPISSPWFSIPIGSMYAIYGNIYHQYTSNVSIYTIHGSYGIVLSHFPSLFPINVSGRSGKRKRTPQRDAQGTQGTPTPKRNRTWRESRWRPEMGPVIGGVGACPAKWACSVYVQYMFSICSWEPLQCNLGNLERTFTMQPWKAWGNLDNITLEPLRTFYLDNLYLENLGSLQGTLKEPWGNLLGTFWEPWGNLEEPWEPWANLGNLGNLERTLGTLGTLGTFTWEPGNLYLGTFTWNLGTFTREPLLGNLYLGTFTWNLGTSGEWVLELLRSAPKPLLWLKTPKHSAVGEKRTGKLASLTGYKPISPTNRPPTPTHTRSKPTLRRSQITQQAQQITQTFWRFPHRQIKKIFAWEDWKAAKNLLPTHMHVV